MVSTDWGSLSIPSWLIEAMNLMGFEKMTPVQAHSIPRLTANQDLVVEAETGSGKTLAFLLPAIARLEKLDPISPGQTNVIVVSPTRELAQQTHKVLENVLKFAPEDSPKLRTQVIYGGNTSTTTSDHTSFMSRVPHILVSTPGRLLQLLSAKHVRPSSLDLLVLDEADRLLDVDSMATLNKIFGILPKQKRVGLFSATMNDAIEDIIRVGLRNPVKITVTNKRATPRALDLFYTASPYSEKGPIALSALKHTKYSKAIVYFPTCISVSYWYQVFSLFLGVDNELKLFSLHGKLPQATRSKTMDSFAKCASKCVLLTTDVAARGLDIDDIDFVVQMDAPTDPNVFVHRAGRTARAGRSGSCLLLLNDDLEQGYVDFMAVRNVHIAEYEPSRSSSSITEKQYLAKLDKFVRFDKARHDLAVRSFLSYVRAYSKHAAKSIFRIQELDLCALARSFGIFRMPRMPELKERSPENNGWLVEPFDWDAYGYKDAAQEKSRIAKLNEAPKSKKEIEETKRIKQRNAVAWSDKLQRKDESVHRREKRQNRAIKTKEAKLAEAKASGQDSDSDADATAEDWKELVKARKKPKVQNAPTFDL